MQTYVPAGLLGRVGIPSLSLAGMGVSAYLLWIRWSGSSALCAGFGGCEVVNASPYSQVAGVPVALIGLGAYSLLLVLGLWRAWGGPSEVALSLLGVSLMGALYSAYLTYVELLVIRAVCPWCVASALLILGVLALSWRELEL